MKSILSKILIMCVAFAFFACEPLPLNRPQTPLSKVISGEMAEDMSRTTVGTGITQAEVDRLVAAGEDRVAADGFSDSSNSAEIIASMVDGMAAAIEGSTVITAKSDILEITKAISEAALNAAAEQADSLTFSRNARAMTGGAVPSFVGAVTSSLLGQLDNYGLDDADTADVAGQLIKNIIGNLDVEAGGTSLTSSATVSASINAVVNSGISVVASNASISASQKQTMIGTITSNAIAGIDDVSSIDSDSAGDVIAGVAQEAVRVTIEAVESIQIEVSTIVETVIDSATNAVVYTVNQQINVIKTVELVIKEASDAATEVADSADTGAVVNAIAGTASTGLVNSGQATPEEAVIVAVSATQEVAISNNLTTVITADSVQTSVETDIFNATGITVTVDTSVITAASKLAEKRANNTLPEVTVDVENTITLIEGNKLTITPTITDADGDAIKVRWSETTGSIVLTSQSEEVLDITMEYPGTYVFVLEVLEVWNIDGTFYDGDEAVSTTINVTVNSASSDKTDAELAEEARQKAKVKLSNNRFAEAMAEYALSISLDPTNEEAKLWWSFLNIAHTVVDPAIQKAASDMGIKTYPKTIEDMFFNKGNWMTQEVATSIWTEYEWVEDPTTGEWEEIETVTVEGTAFFPRIDIPADYLEIQPDLGDGTVTHPEEYLMAVLYNIIRNNPHGLNSFYDNLIGTIASRLQSSAEVMDTVSESAAITFTPEMVPYGSDVISMVWPEQTVLDANGDPALDTDGNPITVYGDIKVGKSEIAGYAAGLRLIASFFQITQATSLDFNLGEWYTALNPVNGAGYASFENPWGGQSWDPEFDWQNLESPLSHGAFMARDNAAQILAGAKDNFIKAAESAKASLAAIKARTDKDDFYLSPGSWDETISKKWTEAVPYMSFAENTITKVLASVQDGETFFLPVYMSDAKVKLYADITKWPSASAYEVETLTDRVYGFNLDKLFETTILDVRHLVELEANSEPVWYDIATPDALTYETLGAKKLTTEDVPALKEDLVNWPSYYFIKANDLTLGGLIDPSNGTKYFSDMATGILQFLDGEKTSIDTKSSLDSKKSLNSFIVVPDADGKIHAFKAFKDAYYPYSSLAPAGEVLSLPGETYTYMTTGSVWSGYFALSGHMTIETEFNVGTATVTLSDIEDPEMSMFFSSGTAKITGLDPAKTYEVFVQYHYADALDALNGYVSIYLYKSNHWDDWIDEYDSAGSSYSADGVAGDMLTLKGSEIAYVSFSGSYYGTRPTNPDDVIYTYGVREVVETATAPQ